MAEHGSEARWRAGCTCQRCIDGHTQDRALRKAGDRPADLDHPDPLAALFGHRQFDRAPWTADAACADHPPDLWFPRRGEAVGTARAICQGCPVRLPCLRYALENNERYGMWGGRSERERRKLRRALVAKVREREAAA
jgi:WhiB family transcriptional regulator, redox-sensing transcriptional regulator